MSLRSRNVANKSVSNHAQEALHVKAMGKQDFDMGGFLFIGTLFGVGVSLKGNQWKTARFQGSPISIQTYIIPNSCNLLCRAMLVVCDL